MDRESPVNLRVEMAPDDGSLLLPGSITITRTTMSVFKLCEMNDEEPLFIGVCSVPLLKIVRQRSKVFPSSHSLVLMSFSEHLFVNASLTAGIVSLKDLGAAGTRATSDNIARALEECSADQLQRLDNPALWRRLRLEFPSPEAFDRCVEALLARKAEEITWNHIQFSTRSRDAALARTHSGGGTESGTSVLSCCQPNHSIPAHSENMYTCRSQPFDHDEGRSSLSMRMSNRDWASQPNNMNRELKTPSDVRASLNAQPIRRALSGGQPTPTQREKLTPAESRDGPHTPQSSRRGRGLPERSHPTDSYRELDTPSDKQTQQYVQSRGAAAGSQLTPTQREKLTPVESRNGPNTPYSSQHGRGLPERSHPTDSYRELDTPSDVRGKLNAQPIRRALSGGQPTPSQREKLTPAESRDGPNTPHSSRRGRGLPERSHPTDSYRELDTPSDVRGKLNAQPIRRALSGGQPTPSQREKLTPVKSCDGSSTLYSSHRGRQLAERDQPPDSYQGLEKPSDVNVPGGTGREGVSKLITDNRAVAQLQHSDRSAAIGQNAGDFQVLEAGSRPMLSSVPNAGAFVALPSGVTDPTHTMTHSTNSAMRAACVSPSEGPLTQRSGKVRTEQQLFLRSVMKFMHHRLHFMQYLHKELVYEAYLLEEARLLGGQRRSTRSAPGSRSISRPTSVSLRSPRRTAHSSVEEESVRLREIEGRLRAVEKLHEEAEQERQEALRLRHEAEKKLELINRDLGSLSRAYSPLCNTVEQPRYDSSHQGPNVPNGSKSHSSRNDGVDLARRSNLSKVADSVNSRVSGLSPAQMGNGQIVIAPSSQHFESEQVDAFLEVDYSTTVLDRYIYGDEWHLVYPAREVDVRFSALIDVCLMLKLPRRLVTITTVTLDQPGLRITAEIRHDKNTLPREMIERRFLNQPFFFLQRLYDLRQCLSNSSSATDSLFQNDPHKSQSVSRMATSRGFNRHGFSGAGGAGRVSASVLSVESAAEDSARDMEIRMREMQRRTEERCRQRECEVANERERKQMTLQRERWGQQVRQLEQEESYQRGRIVLSEAMERQHKHLNRGVSRRSAAVTLPHVLEEEENLKRAMIEVGYARQMQVLAQTQRRNWALVRMATQEAERRARLVGQEREDRLVLDLMMNPKKLKVEVSRPEMDERRHRQRLVETEADQRRQIYTNIRSFLADALQDAVEALIGDEMAARMMLAADEMKERLDVLCSDETPRSRALPFVGVVSPQLWQTLLGDEVAERLRIVNDEERRRRLFQREYILTTEDAVRNVIELQELDEHILMLDDIVHRHRAMLERRRLERKEVAQLATEEQYYRKGLLSDEQDEWEVLMELFDSEQSDLLLFASARLAMTSDFDSPRRCRRFSTTQRQTKPFHYMTFAPEDMDHSPSAALVVEGILGCSVNKNLEVTSIARPLPKVEEDELQFQAGDMILDVAGYSLHSLSHLREVLSNRAVQIQHEAAEEFSGMSEEEMRVNPALQKYIEVLCEHHNFLVQVLRGCDIFQIIVKS